MKVCFSPGPSNAHCATPNKSDSISGSQSSHLYNKDFNWISAFLWCSRIWWETKWQDDLCSFPRQTIQYHSNPSLANSASLCPASFCTPVFLLWEPHEQYEKEKWYDSESWTPRSVGIQCATGEEWRNNSSKNEEMEPKWKQHRAMGVTGGGSKVQCCKEGYCIGTWNVSSMNQGELEVVKEKIARVNIDILGTSELKWTRIRKFKSAEHYICYCGQKSLRRNGIPLIINKRVQNTVLGCNLKNERMISVHFQGKPFNITVIKGYAPNSNAEEAEVEWFCEDLWDLLEIMPKKRCPFHHRGWERKSRKSRDTWSNR